jgi:polyisoprenoid-binding protein YceI
MSKTIWNLDPTHSEIRFKAKHMVISTVTGHFNAFNAHVEVEGDDFESASIAFTADVKSLVTGQEQRDQHLLSDDFFNAETYPQLAFKSTSLKKLSDTEYSLTGDLTIRDVTKSVTLDVEYGGTIKDPYGFFRAGFGVTGKINRKEFGLKWSALLETGGAVVSDDIKLDCHVEFTKAQ